MIKGLIRTSWFAYADLVCVSIGGVLGFYFSQAGGNTGRGFLTALLVLPVVLAFLPWILRSLAGEPPFQRTFLDIFILIFILSAGVGVWAAYDRHSAWSIFWLLLTSVLMYYAVSAQPQNHVWPIITLLVVYALVVSVGFILVFDWHSQPADIGFLSRLGIGWMEIRPVVSPWAGTFALRPLYDVLNPQISIAHPLNPNISGGVIAMIFPLIIATGLKARREHRIGLMMVAILAGLFVGSVLLLTSSRAAWLALGISTEIWLFWGLSGPAAKKLRVNRRFVFVAVLTAQAVIFLWMVIASPSGLLGLASRLPGLPSSQSRLDLGLDTIRLIKDFPFTGGGLGSFPGLYSQYIQDVPFYYFAYGHDLYLDVTLEQGPLGFVSLLIVLAGGIWILCKELPAWTSLAHADLFRWGIFTSFMVMGLHGLVDDPLYSSLNGILLLILPALALAGASAAGLQPLAYFESERNKENHQGEEVNRLKKPVVLGRSIAKPRLWILIAGGIFIVTVIVAGKSLLGEWYSNLGAIKMARVELQGFPTGSWDFKPGVSALQPAAGLFDKALRWQENNRTAQHRLGLIAIHHQDFSSAIHHLEIAARLDPGHRGVQEALGFAYAWSGDYASSAAVLEHWPDTSQELRSYLHWWFSKGRIDLAISAYRVLKLMSASQAPGDGS